MKHYYLLFTALFLSVSLSAQFSIIGGIESSHYSITSSYSDDPIVGEVLDGLDDLIDQTSDISLLGQSIGIEIPGLEDWANKDRTRFIQRYQLLMGGRLHLDGIESITALKVGVRSVQRENLSFRTYGVSVNGTASVYLNAGLINLFGGDLEPLKVGRLTEFNWLESLAVGASLETIGASIEKTLDAKVQLEFSRYEQSFIVYGKASHYLNNNISGAFSIGVIYTK